MASPETDAYLRTFAVQIRDARRELRLSREELAARACVHPNTIAASERGERDLSILTQTRVLAVLGCREIAVRDDGYAFRLGGSSPASERTDILALTDPWIVWSIGQSLRRQRRALGFSLEDVSRRTGLHRNSVWNCERGLVVPSGNSVFRLYRALGVSSLRAGGWGVSLSGDTPNP